MCVSTIFIINSALQNKQCDCSPKDEKPINQKIKFLYKRINKESIGSLFAYNMCSTHEMVSPLHVICSFLAHGEHPGVGQDWVLFLYSGFPIFCTTGYILNTIIPTMKWYRHHETWWLPVVSLSVQCSAGQCWSMLGQMRTFLHLLFLLLLLFQIIIGLSSTRSWTKKASPLNARKTSETLEMSPWE